MLSVDDKFPSFSLRGVMSLDHPAGHFIDVSDSTYAGKWLIVFFWPKDFTFVCPTEIAAFGEMHNDFVSLNAQILGVSVDSDYVHLAWRKQEKQLANVPFPMLSDIKRELVSALGVENKAAGVAQRATYIVDPDGYIRFVSVTDIKVGRNSKDVLRVLSALQSDELCACNWQVGDKAVQAS